MVRDLKMVRHCYGQRLSPKKQALINQAFRDDKGHDMLPPQALMWGLIKRKKYESIQKENSLSFVLSFYSSLNASTRFQFVEKLGDFFGDHILLQILRFLVYCLHTRNFPIITMSHISLIYLLHFPQAFNMFNQPDSNGLYLDGHHQQVPNTIRISIRESKQRAFIFTWSIFDSLIYFF